MYRLFSVHLTIYIDRYIQTYNISGFIRLRVDFPRNRAMTLHFGLGGSGMARAPTLRISTEENISVWKRNLEASQPKYLCTCISQYFMFKVPFLYYLCTYIYIYGNRIYHLNIN